MPFAKDNRAMLFQLLIVAGLALIIFFATLNIGSLVNGTIGTVLIEDYEDNIETGRIAILYEDDATFSGSHKLNLTGTNAGELTGADSYFLIDPGVSDVDFTLVVNGQDVNRSDNLSAGNVATLTFAYFLTNSTVNSTDTVITFDYTVTTDTSEIDMVAAGSYYQAGDWRTPLENSSYNTIMDLSGDYDNTVDALAVAAVVMAITLPLAAVVAIRKFF